MSVVGAELSDDADLHPLIVVAHVKKTLRHHHGNDIRGITQPVHTDIHHIKSLSENLVAESEIAHDLPHNRHLVVFNYLIRHVFLHSAQVFQRRTESGPELVLYYQYIRYGGKIELLGVA